MATEPQQALRTRVVNILCARPHSHRELVKKLTDKGVAPETAQELSLWAASIGLLNEADYAAATVRHYSAKGYGPYKIRDELYKRGIPRDLWDAALAHLPSPEEGIAAFLARHLKGTDPKSKKRAADALARRGFSYRDISDALRSAGEDFDDCEDFP